MLPSHVDGGAHVVRQDDELRGSVVVMAAETYDVDLSRHSGRKIARKAGVGKGSKQVAARRNCSPSWGVRRKAITACGRP
jgi:hypothetical protein